MTNFKKVELDAAAPRAELHDLLALTSAEVSVNHLPAGCNGVPFIHAHTANEEIYGIIEGKGELYIDGEVLPIAKGSWFRIDPAGHRAMRAASDEGLTYVCIQAKAGSLGGFTMTDAKLIEGEKAPWF